jgi:hypothetical protein
LTDLTAAQVTRAVEKSPASEESWQKSEHWEIVRAAQARRDDQKIDDLLAGDGTRVRNSWPMIAATCIRTLRTLRRDAFYGADDKEGRTLQSEQAEKIKDGIYMVSPRNPSMHCRKTEEILVSGLTICGTGIWPDRHQQSRSHQH